MILRPTPPALELSKNTTREVSTLKRAMVITVFRVGRVELINYGDPLRCIVSGAMQAVHTARRGPLQSYCFVLHLFAHCRDHIQALIDENNNQLSRLLL